ncbi:MAG: DUF2934 domain-containing protein [Gammaproteobacteria bacterium]|nr:DUF2934 domain-containing protein [Gammaproteobacteria bacterium]
MVLLLFEKGMNMTDRNETSAKNSASRRPARKPASRAATKGIAAGDECGDAPRRDPVSAEERQRMIATAAYFRAERRDFESGHEFEDWLEAEAEIDRQLACG